MAGVRQLLLRHEKFQVLHPHTRHLVHGDKCPLIGIVEALYSAVIQW